MKTPLSSLRVLSIACVTGALLSSVAPTWARQDPLTKQSTQPFLSGSRVVGLNDWHGIELRAKEGDPFALAVQKMRRCITGNKLEEARTAFEEAVSLDPNRAPYTEWADTLAARGDVRGAVALYRYALSDPEKCHGFIQGSPPPAWLMRYCLLLLRTGDNKAAHEAYQRGFDLVWRSLDYEGFRDEFDLKPTKRLVNPRTLKAAAYTIIGLTNVETRTWDEYRMPPDMAIAEYQKALAAKPDFDVAQIFLSKAYKKKEFLEAGSAEKAAAALQIASGSADEAVRAKAKELLKETRAQSQRD